MGKMSIRELNRTIQEKKTAPVYLFSGPETSLRRNAEKQIEESLIPGGLEMLNLTRYEKKGEDPHAIIAGLETLPVMAEKRVVILAEECGILESDDKAVRDAFSRYLKKPSPSTVLIFESVKPDRRKALVKELVKTGVEVEFKKLDERDISNWVKKRLAAQGVSIDRETLSYLIYRTHYLDSEKVTTQTLESAVSMLASLGEETLSREAVKGAIPAGMEDNIFEITERTANGDPAGAVILLRGLVAEGESPLGVFGLLVRQIRNLVSVRLMTEQGRSQKEIASSLHLPAFVVRKNQAMVRGYRPGRLESLLVRAADLDFNVKTGITDPALAVELLIFETAKKA